jgi:hypothetical protein
VPHERADILSIGENWKPTKKAHKKDSIQTLFHYTPLSTDKMILSEALNSDTIFNELTEVAQGSLLPQVTTLAYPAEPPQMKHPLLLVEDGGADTSMQPPSKRARTNSDQFLRTPCKARGMSNKHNFDTAYLDIPVDAPHGLLLSCSHPECAESGRKFRYCTVCASPVAKRNFPKRHGHGLIRSAKDLKAVDYYTASFVDISSVADASCYPCIEQTVAAPTFEKPRHRRMVSYDESTYGAAVQQPSPAVQQPVASRPPATDSLLNLSVKEQQWLDLLHKRPNLKQESNMAAWMDKIICFSENKESALRNSPVLAPMTMEQPPYFAPVSPPQQQRDTIVTTPPFLEPVTIEDEPASSPAPIYDYFLTRSISPFVANIHMNIFDETAPALEPSAPPSAPVDQFLQSLELEAPVVLDNVDLTTFFD